MKNVIKYFPKYSKKINKLLDRVFDLHKIFSNFFYYNIKQLGSTSIKKTLPILCPKFSYSNLEIQNGGQATQEFYKMIFKNLNESEKNQIKKSLLEYCKLDTLAMFEILNKIKILIE